MTLDFRSKLENNKELFTQISTVLGREPTNDEINACIIGYCCGAAEGMLEIKKLLEKWTT